MAFSSWVEDRALMVRGNDMGYFTDLLRRANYVKRVYLPPNSIRNFDEFCTWFAVSTPRATELDLRDIECTDANLARLAFMLDTTNRLVKLHVTATGNFLAHGGSAFVDAVGRSTTLKELTIMHPFRGDKNAATGNILTMLRTNKSLRRLKIDGLGLCSYTVSDVADAFAKNTTLKVLKFYNPRFDWHFSDIFAFLAGNSTVEYLAIVGGSYWNQPSKFSVDIGEFIEANRSIKRLSMQGPDFSAGVIEGLAVALASNTSLVDLRIGWPLPNKMLRAFGAALHRNSTLLRLKIQAHWMAGADVLTSFVRDVVESNSLRTIHIGTDLPDTVDFAFRDGISANFALNSVAVNDTPMAPVTMTRNRVFHEYLLEVARTAFRCLIFCWEECGKRGLDAGAGAVADVGTVPVDLLANILLNTLSQRVRRVVFELNNAGPAPRQYDIARAVSVVAVDPLPSSAATRFAEFSDAHLVIVTPPHLIAVVPRAVETRVRGHDGSAPEDRGEPAPKKARSSE